MLPGHPVRADSGADTGRQIRSMSQPIPSIARQPR